jgi:thiamine transporter ThiT
MSKFCHVLKGVSLEYFPYGWDDVVWLAHPCNFWFGKSVWLYSINTKNQIQSQTIKHCIIQTIALIIHPIKQAETQALAFYSN